jgi:hypothetical protein
VVVQLTIEDQVRGVRVDDHSLAHLPLHRLGVVADQLHGKLHLLLLPLVVLGGVLVEGVVLVAMGVLEGLKVLTSPDTEAEACLASAM